jgi:hypothetical protein
MRWNVAHMVQLEQMMIDYSFDKVEQTPAEDHLSDQNAQRRWGSTSLALMPKQYDSGDRQD